MVTIVIPWPILHFLFILWFSSTLARNLEIPRYETAYACEGKMLKIECKDGELIRLIRANYGRFSITICNDHGNTDWSVNCMSPKSLRVLHNRCSQNQNCSILASTSTFGDPCAGTLKYLEAHYQCMPATTTTTTNRPSPPWLITSQPPSVWSTVKPTTRPSLPRESPLSSSTATPAPAPPVQVPNAAAKTSPSTTSTGSTLPQQPVKQSPPPQPVVPIEPVVPSGELTTMLYTTVPSKKHPEESTISSYFVPSPSTPWNQEEITHYCSPVTVRNLYWNWTRVSERTVQPCPGGATGLARWRCSPGSITATGEAPDEPRWSPATPDLSECRSVWLTSLESRVIEGDSLISITSDLSQVTSSKTLYGGDMMITTKIIKKMAQKMSEDIQTFPDQRQREAIVTELLHGVVRTGSNLLDSSQHPSWRDLSYKEQMRVATSLLIGLEENAFLLADTVIREKTVVQTVKNIMLSVRVLETKNIKTETFPSEAVTDKWSASNDWLQLPREALLENSEGGLVRLVFVAFDRLEEILQWQPESAIEYTGIQRNLSRVLNSKIISASLGKGRHIQLSQPVRLFLRHLKTDNVSNPSCVFWDYTMSTWSEEGCQVESTNKTHTTCLCDHLTNFAILMDVHATYLPVAHQMALQIITYVGCIISIGCLILTIITFQTFRGLKSDRTTIHKNLCFCLLLAEVLFVVGIGRTSERVLCGVVAGLLHLFFLCAFAWMFLEGFQLYVMLIEVFEAEKSRIRWYYLVAYGIPLFIVTISAIIDPFSYGTEQYCWLRADNFFIFSFVGPVIIVILANIVFLVMAIVMMCRHGNTTVSMKNKEHSRLASASGEEENALRTKLQYHLTWLRGAFVLVFLLGLTWTFGLLFLNKESVVMAYIFTILNSLQGLFIFVFHCIQNEKVRKEYRKFIRRHSWLPKCLRCMKSRSGSSVLSKERRTSLYGGSNGNTSAPNSHSTDNSGLSPYGTSVGTNVNNIVISNNLNILANMRPSPLVQVLNHHNNASTTTSTNHNRLHNISQQESVSDPISAVYRCGSGRRGLQLHGLLQQYILQRDWSSRSCTTMNRIGNPSVSVSFCATATMVATMSRNHFHHHRPPDDGTSPVVTTPTAVVTAVASPPSPSLSPTPSAPPLSQLPHVYNSEMPVNAINTITLPNFRNFDKVNCAATMVNNGNNIVLNPNFPKSISTWGPLHKNLHWKNISFKSYSRDSGHGGSEQEESPRSHIASTTDRDGRLTSGKDCRRQPYLSADINPHIKLPDHVNLSQAAQAELSDYLHAKNEAKQHQLHSHLTNRKKQLPNPAGGSCFLRPTGPWNHTYTEIHDERMHRDRDPELMGRDLRDRDRDRDLDRGAMALGMGMNEDEADPVYEEIERGGEIHASDMSDEDGKRQSDMSRQSSRSYGDHRPLIPHSPGPGLEHYGPGVPVGDIEHYRMYMYNMYRGGHGENARSLAAVLDGETVVCHLEPPEFFSHDLYNARTVVLPPNSES